jgi:FkbM family methyltransferase
VQRLDQLPGFHLLVRWLKVRQLAACFLRGFPITKTLPGSGVRYRHRYLETFFLADEFFTRNAYSRAIDSKNTRTFADLGCNAGLFAALLAHETGRSDLQGLMVDANLKMVEETRWLLSANKLGDIVPLHGLVGATGTGEEAEFYLLPSNLGSSQYPVYEPGKPVKGEWKRTTVPRIDLEATWRKHFGDLRCHLLKVDIEGSEGTLLKTETEFLCRVDLLVLEWHKWIVSRASIEESLRRQGFALAEVLEESETTGIACYNRATR